MSTPDVEGFTDADRTRAIEMAQDLATMSSHIAQLEHRQAVMSRRVRHLPQSVAVEVLRLISKRSLILIGLGIALGAALGGTGIELVRALVAQWVRTLSGPH